MTIILRITSIARYPGFLVVEGMRQDSTGYRLVITVFENDPGIPANFFMETPSDSETRTQYMCLWGGQPSAYETFDFWDRNYSVVGEMHEFDAEFEHEDSGVRFYPVVEYRNLDDRCVDEMGRIVFEWSVPQGRVLMTRLGVDFSRATQLLMKNSVVNLVQINRHLAKICSELLPELIKETLETRVAITHLAPRPQGKPTHAVNPDCGTRSFERERKSQPSHPSHPGL